MSVKLILFLFAGTVLMFFPIWRMDKVAKVPIWKSAVHSVVLTLMGTIGTLLMFYVENGYFGGISFFGAVFFVPLVFPLVALALKIPYGQIMDRCAVGECVMLALMKVHCMLGGCCIGRVLGTTAQGTVIRFPSRLAEMAVAGILFAILFIWFKKGKRPGLLYPWYMLLYGIVRFGLNFLRELPEESKLLLPFGNIWSLVAIVFGLVWLLVWKNRQIQRQYQEARAQQE